MVKTKNMYIPLNVGQVGHFRTPKIHGKPSDLGGTLDGSRHFVHILKVVANVGYRGVLHPIYHSKQTFKLMSSNRTQFCHGKERERHPPMHEPYTSVVNITEPKPSRFSGNSITKLNLIKISHSTLFRQARFREILKLAKMGEITIK
jgi:hypothetical protein